MKGFIGIPIIFLLIAGVIGIYFINPPKVQQDATPSAEITSSPTSSAAATPTYKPTKSPTPKPTSASTDLNLNSSVKLLSVSPNPGRDGQQITLKGSNFGSATGKIWFYSLSGVAAGGPTVNKWSDTEVVFTQALLKAAQFYIEIEKSDGQKSNKIFYTLSGGQPYIESVSQTTFKKGSTVTITGTDFGSSNGQLNFYKSPGAGNLMGYGIIGLWNNTQIIFTVPSTLSSEEYGFQVITSDDRRSSYKYFNVVD